MPELPEVETIVRELVGENLIGQTIMDAQVHWSRTIDRISAPEFRKRICGQKFMGITRRGKLLVFQLSEDWLLVHLRMTGKFTFIEPGDEPETHERVRLFLSDGRALSFQDQRKFGRWYLLEEAEEKTGKLGLEPFSEEFTLRSFQKVLEGRKGAIKPFLLDQSRIAGLGNIYVDESLWEAKIHPLRLLETLTDKEVKNLYKAIPMVLQRGIDNLGTSLGNRMANYFSVSGRRGGNQHQLLVFRRDGESCSRCGNTIVKIRVAQRGTHLCPHCQK